jgi:phthalate 4,5-dioxygenase oxygenase subunit
MKAEINERITRIGPDTPCGRLMRQYWQPVALLDEFDPALDPRMGVRAVKAVRVLGQDLVLWRDAQGRLSLLDRDCPHRGADLAYARNEGDGLRCPFHGWKFDTTGQCIQTPAEPAGSPLCRHVRQRSYPLQVHSGVAFAWLGPADSPVAPFPRLDCLSAPASHTFAFKGLWRCNWLQAFELGIDPAHASYLHRFFQDAPLADSYGKQFRGASAGAVDGERWPMTRILREFDQPQISVEDTALGLRLTALRAMDPERTHVRITHSIFPHTFVIPLSETMTITQIHLPVDDTHTYWYAIFTSFADPVDRHAMRAQRLQAIDLPDYLPKSGRHNQWGFDPEEQAYRTYLGMGEDDINIHDQWACESMGPIQDRTREHLGTSDKAIMRHRRMLLQAIDEVQAGRSAPGLAHAEVARCIHGPDTLDGIAPAQDWRGWCQRNLQARRKAAPWCASEAPQEPT